VRWSERSLDLRRQGGRLCVRGSGGSAASRVNIGSPPGSAVPRPGGCLLRGRPGVVHGGDDRLRRLRQRDAEGGAPLGLGLLELAGQQVARSV
jgi:hypothetical protein